MRRLIFSFMATASLACSAQDSTWVSLSYPEFGCSWQMPAQPTIPDTLNVRIYALELDSGMAITVHFIKDVLPDTSAGSLYQAAFDVEGDTLRAMAQVMLGVSQGELLAIADSATQGIPYLDIALALVQQEFNALLDFRLFYWKQRFISFCVSGSVAQRATVRNLASIITNQIQLTAL